MGMAMQVVEGVTVAKTVQEADLAVVGGEDNGGGSSDADVDGNGDCESANGKPTIEACPGTKRKRSDSFAIGSHRIVKREEEELISTNPLKDALNSFGTDKQGNSLASATLDTAEGILTNKFPKESASAYVTGLKGHYKLPQKLIASTGTNQQTFPSGTDLFWQIRWDYDRSKGPHVNAQFGFKDSSKFSYNLDPSQYTNGDRQASMANIAKGLNKQCKYSSSINRGKDTPNVGYDGTAGDGRSKKTYSRASPMDLVERECWDGCVGKRFLGIEKKKNIEVWLRSLRIQTQ